MTTFLENLENLENFGKLQWTDYAHLEEFLNFDHLIKLPGKLLKARYLRPGREK